MRLWILGKKVPFKEKLSPGKGGVYSRFSPLGNPSEGQNNGDSTLFLFPHLRMAQHLQCSPGEINCCGEGSAKGVEFTGFL